MEQELVAKVEELISTLDSAREYKEIANAMLDSSIIVILATSTVLFIALAFNMLQIFGYLHNLPILPFFSVYPVVFYFLLLIIPLGIWIGRRRTMRKRMEKWKEVLKEGSPGAIKLLTELDWKSVFEDIRLMKWAIIIRLIDGVLLHYHFIQILMVSLFVGIIIIGFPAINLQSLFFGYLELYPITIYALPIPIAIFITKSDFKNYYQKLGSVDYLLWSLRWLYNEFKGIKFEA